MTAITEGIALEIDDSGTDDPIVTLNIVTTIGTIKIMAAPSQAIASNERGLILENAHIQSDVGTPNAFGPANLIRICAAICKDYGYDYIEVKGNLRTTGANPGRRPRSVRYPRRL